MHPEIFSIEQKELLPLVKSFRREFYLVGGTAIALQIGHRKSLYFDLFKATPFISKKILDKISANGMPYAVTRRVKEQINLTISNVKITFFEYPYSIETPVDFDKILRMPDLLTLGAIGQEFSAKLFRSQLAYHKDINYSKAVEFLSGYEINEEEVKTFLIDQVLIQI